MTSVRNSRGVVLATAAAAFFTAGCADKGERASPDMAQEGESLGQQLQQQGQSAAESGKESATEVKVACFGINECKGKSECATPNNACKGLNQCKGQGYVYVSLKECETAGGKVITPSM